MRTAKTSLLVLSVVATLFSCKQEMETAENSEQGTQQVTLENDYPISPADIRDVQLHDDFWLPVIKRVQEKTIAYALEKCREEGRLDNFLIAGKRMDGKVKGAMPFDDTDVYKILEGASYSLISAANPELDSVIDEVVDIIAIGQEEDGYLTTWRTIDGKNPPAPWVEVKEGERWEALFMSHELYNAGHLYEAAAAHFEATGKRNFLDIALKNADLMVNTFGEGEHKIHAVPGHQIIETGLIKLYRITGKDAYLDLARYFLDNRGKPVGGRELFGPYSQDHIPVTEQKEAVGHAVRAVYMYAAMTDIAALEKDTAYLGAVHDLWDNVVNKKIYVTGGIGALHDGEAFGGNYELPNLTAYNETCAAIGNVYWNHRLHNLEGDVRYFDVIERTLYNGLLSGLSLDGTHFFYPNALEADGSYEFNRGACTRQSWFDCSCCPTNLIRFIPSIPRLIYSTSGNTAYVNLYASNTAELHLEGGKIKMEQSTSYPWNGKVTVKVEPETEQDFSIKLRIPSWARNEVLPGDLYQYVSTLEEKVKVSVNGTPVAVTAREGYITLDRTWNPGDEITMILPMEVRKVRANEKVEEDRGKLSLEYGPLVYAVEEADNPGIMDELTLAETTTAEMKMEEELLGGVLMLETETFKAIPYYAWSNRGIGKMKVWIPTKENN